MGALVSFKRGGILYKRKRVIIFPPSGHLTPICFHIHTQDIYVPCISPSWVLSQRKWIVGKEQIPKVLLRQLIQPSASFRMDLLL